MNVIVEIIMMIIIIVAAKDKQDYFIGFYTALGIAILLQCYFIYVINTYRDLVSASLVVFVLGTVEVQYFGLQ